MRKHDWARVGAAAVLATGLWCGGVKADDTKPGEAPAATAQEKPAAPAASAAPAVPAAPAAQTEAAKPATPAAPAVPAAPTAPAVPAAPAAQSAPAAIPPSVAPTPPAANQPATPARTATVVVEQAGGEGAQRELKIQSKIGIVTEGEGAQPVEVVLKSDENGNVVVSGAEGLRLTGRAINLDQLANTQSEYWLGVHLDELPEVAKSQLNLDHGMVVNMVVPESPAAKAGLKQYDIVLKAGDQLIRDPMELIKAVNDAKEKELKLAIVRGGKEQTITATPAKRPANAAVVSGFAIDPNMIKPAPELKELESALRKLEALKAGKAEMFFLRPPVFVPPADVDVAVGATGAAPLPHNVTVTVTKSGEGPAKVIVERDGKKWETTGDKLEAVPADVRVHLQSMLAPQHGVRVWDFAGPNNVQARQIVVHGGGSVGGVTTAPPIPAQPLPPGANVVQVTPGVPAGVPTYAPPGVPARVAPSYSPPGVPQVHVVPAVPAVPGVPGMPGAPGAPNARGVVESYKVYLPQNVPAASGVLPRRDQHVAGGSATHDAVNQKLDRVLERLDKLAAPPAASDDVQTQLKQMRKELDMLKKKVEKK